MIGSVFNVVFGVILSLDELVDTYTNIKLILERGKANKEIKSFEKLIEELEKAIKREEQKEVKKSDNHKKESYKEVRRSEKAVKKDQGGLSNPDDNRIENIDEGKKSQKRTKINTLKNFLFNPHNIVHPKNNQRKNKQFEQRDPKKCQKNKKKILKNKAFNQDILLDVEDDEFSVMSKSVISPTKHKRSK